MDSSRKFSRVSDRNLGLFLAEDVCSGGLFSACTFEANRHLFGVEFVGGSAMAKLVLSWVPGIKTICSNCFACIRERVVSKWCSPLDEGTSLLAADRTRRKVLDIPNALSSWLTLEFNGREKSNSLELSELEHDVWFSCWSSLPWWAVTLNWRYRVISDKVFCGSYWFDFASKWTVSWQIFQLSIPGSFRTISWRLSSWRFIQFFFPVFQWSYILGFQLIFRTREVNFNRHQNFISLLVEKLQITNKHVKIT